jgi:transglutaminase-like putative cysteine protease
MSRFGLAIILLAITAPAPAKDDPSVRRATVRWTYHIVPSPGTETINFRCLVPRDREHWQKVVTFRFTHEPTERIHDGNDAFERFFFRNPTRPITIGVEAVVELRSVGLLNKRPKPQVGLPDAQRDALTQPERYIESDDPRIIALSKKVVGRTVEQQLESIQRITESTLERGDFDPKDRGAISAIEWGRGDCSDFADLFVALCRAKRIPAVVCEGFTIDAGLWKRKPPHHAWVMVWLDDRGWTRFDPFDVANRVAKHGAQSSWYIHLSDQRNSVPLDGHHLYRID